MTDNVKKQMHRVGFFSVLILLMFFILVLVVYFTRNTGKSTMKNLLQECVNEAYGNQFTVTESLNIDLPITVSSYGFSVIQNETSEEDSQNGFVIAVRMIGSYGPVIGVYFLQNPSSELIFLKTIGLPEDSNKFDWEEIPAKQIEYWGNIIKNVLMEEE